MPVSTAEVNKPYSSSYLGQNVFAFHISAYFLRHTVNTNQEINQIIEEIFVLAGETDKKFALFICDIKWFTTKVRMYLFVSFILLTKLTQSVLYNFAKKKEALKSKLTRLLRNEDMSLKQES